MPKGPRKLSYWWWLLFNRIGANLYEANPAVDQNWPEGRHMVRGKHGVMMLLDLQNWSDRRTYFSGVYYQEDIVFLLKSLIRPGDIIIDAGANVGMITILAARLTGPSGLVYSFEPDPAALQRLQTNISINKFKNVKTIEAGLSDREGRATLAGVVDNSQKWVNMITILAAEGGLPEAEHRVAIRVVRGDDVLTDLDLSRPAVVKMDIEGHEVHALRGLCRLLERREVAVVCEVSCELLSRASSTPDDLFSLMKKHDFNIFQFSMHQTRWSRRLRLTKLDAPLSQPIYDVLFLRPGTALWNRINNI